MGLASEDIGLVVTSIGVVVMLLVSYARVNFAISFFRRLRHGDTVRKALVGTFTARKVGPPSDLPDDEASERDG